jgi:hypothetical protein
VVVEVEQDVESREQMVVQEVELEALALEGVLAQEEQEIHHPLVRLKELMVDKEAEVLLFQEEWEVVEQLFREVHKT